MKTVVITTVVVLACFAAALVAYNYLDPTSISNLVSSGESQLDVESGFEVEAKHHGGKRLNDHSSNGKKHNGGGNAKSPAPVHSGSQKCFIVNADKLNVRSSACGTATTTVSRGTKVVAVGTAATKSPCSLGTSLRWQQITSPVAGYVTDSYLTPTSCGATPPPPPPSSSGDLSLATLKACMPGISNSKATLYLPYLNSAMREGSINNARRKAAFLAQVGHESASLVYMEEIASGAAYEGRRDLGNTQPGDGVRFKGRGPIQITGRANYDAAGKALGLDLINNPQQAATPQVGFRLAVWFWNRAGLSSYADQNTQSAFDTITRRINGGTNGKADRDRRWRTCKSVLGA